MISQKALEFWNVPELEKQKILIAGSVPWDVSERTADTHRKMIATPLVQESLDKAETPVILELGCGIGRLLWGWSGKVIGVDISSNMLAKAAELARNKKAENVEFVLTDGETIKVDSNSVDFAYSFLVFQHIQTKKEVASYLKEIERVLRPGGLFRLQTLKGHPHPEQSFGGFHGRFYPSLPELKKEVEALTSMRVVEEQEGLGWESWLWLTLQR